MSPAYATPPRPCCEALPAVVSSTLLTLTNLWRHQSWAAISATVPIPTDDFPAAIGPAKSNRPPPPFTSCSPPAGAAPPGRDLEAAAHLVATSRRPIDSVTQH
ncbi:hypothetical protein [Streptomyces sp. NPDC051636]|uniref:hypothetical protein n=1 Tax=Streptomyces sp. NPDC051636 TaxID=3365663 RepID=UPI0037A84C43